MSFTSQFFAERSMREQRCRERDPHWQFIAAQQAFSDAQRAGDSDAMLAALDDMRRTYGELKAAERQP